MTGFLTSCKSNVNDGGQWDVVVNLLGTYGVIPGFLFRDSRTGTESCPLNKIVITHLRADVMLQCNLYPEFQVSASAQGTLKVMRVTEKMMKEVWNMLMATLGIPPSPDEKIKWEYVDVRGTAKSSIRSSLARSIRSVYNVILPNSVQYLLDFNCRPQRHSSLSITLAEYHETVHRRETGKYLGRSSRSLFNFLFIYSVTGCLPYS